MNEKQRILLVALIVFIIFVAVSIIDGFFTVMTYERTYEQGYVGHGYWVAAMMIMLTMMSIGVGFASLLGDYGSWSLEDYFALVLLGAMPWILVLGGLLDAISYTTQTHFRRVSVTTGAWSRLDYRWPWLDPSQTHGFPMICYVASRLLHYDSTVTAGVLLGSAISLILVFALWTLYYCDV